MQLPTAAKLTCCGSTPARPIASLMTSPPSSAGSMPASEPPNVPTALRTALNTTTSLFSAI